MNKHIGREAVLLTLSAAPILLSFYILSIDAEWARRFIKVQLVGTSLSNWLTLGLAPTLSALALSSTLRPPRWLLVSGSLTSPGVVAVAWLMASTDLVDAALISSLATIAILYRLPSKRALGRAVLLAQFLVIAGAPGRAVTALVVAASLAHLTYLGAFRRVAGDRVPAVTVAHAYLVSVVKDFFYRGHYLLLSSIGLAGQHYAAILRLLDITSRPTDYVFQRLVDEDSISHRLRYVLFSAPASAAAVAVLLIIIPSFFWTPTPIIFLTAAASSLVVITKYLAYEQNSRLRFTSMTTMYVSAAVFSLPAAAFPYFAKVPVIYFTVSLCVLALELLTFRLRLMRERS